VLAALATPPEVPAEALARLLERNHKPFVEYHSLRGFRLLRGLAYMAWLSLRGPPAPLSDPLAIRPPYEPPLFQG